MQHDDGYDERYRDAMREVLGSRDRVMFEYLYDCLSIIDGKAASLMQFNSIIIAAATVLIVLLVQAKRAQPSFGLAAGLTGLVMVAMLVSSCVALATVWVYWANPSDIVAGRYLERLLDRRTRRTFWYRVSWVISIACLPLFLIAVVAVSLVAAR